MFYVGRDTYANVFKVGKKKKKNGEGSYVWGNVSTSETDQDGNKIYSHWMAYFVGDAKDDILRYEHGSSFIIKKCKLTNVHYQDEDGEYQENPKVTIFEIEPGEYSKMKSKKKSRDYDDDEGGDEDYEPPKKTKKKKSKPVEDDVDDDDEDEDYEAPKKAKKKAKPVEDDADDDDDDFEEVVEPKSKKTRKTKKSAKVEDDAEISDDDLPF